MINIILLQIFKELPPTSQAAIIASFVTLLGVILATIGALIGSYITHRGNERRFSKQLEYDRQQRRIEREMALRKQVYLDAAEAIVAGLGMITRYADLRIPPEDLAKEFEEKRSAIAKVHLIAQEATVNAVLAFTFELGSAIKRLALHRQPLVQAQARLKILNDQIQIFGRERDRMIDLMKQLDFEGNKEAHRWAFVGKTFEFEHKRVNDALEEQKVLDAKLRADWGSFAAECFGVSTKISELLIPAVKAVRDELELPFDYDSYKAAMEETLKREDRSLRDYLDELQKPKGG